jgi:hypothetical protein
MLEFNPAPSGTEFSSCSEKITSSDNLIGPLYRTREMFNFGPVKRPAR